LTSNSSSTLDHLKLAGKERGCFINPEKSRILISCSGHSIIPELTAIHPQLADELTYSINSYSHKKSKTSPTPIGVELTDGFRLLGTPLDQPPSQIPSLQNNSPPSATKWRLSPTTSPISTPDSNSSIFNTCTLQKLPHLLGADIMHHLPLDFDPNAWLAWNGPLTQGLNKIINSFFTTLLSMLHANNTKTLTSATSTPIKVD